MSRQRRIILSVAAVAAAIALWDGLAYADLIDAQLFPPWSKIALRALALLVGEPALRADLMASATRFAIATVLTLPLAAGLALLAGSSPTSRAVLAPFVSFALPLPKVAIYPLVLVVFGIGDTGKIVLIGLGMFFPSFINILAGALRLQQSALQDMLTVFEVRGWRRWRDFYARGLAVDVITGVRASLGYGLTLVVVSEMTASNDGLGNFVWRAWDAFAVVDMYAGVFILCVFGWLIQASLDRALDRVLQGNVP